MNVLLIFDDNFPIETSTLLKYLGTKLTHIRFQLYSKKFEINEAIISKPKTFNLVEKEIGELKNEFNKVFCFTEKQYNDNYFIHEYNNLSIFSIYGWPFLTDLPISNGIIYFIIDYFALEINPSDFRHKEITGCIYDFLQDKRGIDNGIRQARFCSNCLKRVSDTIIDENDLLIFNDLKILMDHLSNCSRWNKDILEDASMPQNKISKRTCKGKDGLQIVIASPGDTESERKVLLESLERKFRIGNHEKHCGFRIMVNGWEDLASQSGYPQDVINQKLIEESDFVVAIFKHRLGTPTKDISGNQRAESGTVEEILQALDRNKKNHPIGMAYFFSQAPVISLDAPEKEKIEKEWNRLKDFKKIIQDQMIYKPYTDSSDLLSIVLTDLEKNIIDYIEK